MKQYVSFLALCLFACFSFAPLARAQQSPLVTGYDQPDSVKVGSLLTSITVAEIGRKPVQAGLQTNIGAIWLKSSGREKSVIFSFPAGAKVVATGINVQPSGPGKLAWNVDWQPNKTYQLMLVVALSDSEMTSHNMLYSGYILMPDQKKWKLIGSCLIDGQRTTLTKLATFASGNPRTGAQARFSELSLRRTNRSWKNLLNTTTPIPDISSKEGYFDQDEQNRQERAQIEKTVADDKWATLTPYEGIYYTMLREGTGKQVTETDSIVAYYKGYLFSDKSVFAELVTETAKLPLTKVIKGFQKGASLCRVGGKIQVVIPSRYAFGAATNSTLFYPNSVIVFEIDVVDTKQAN
jgi:FKBP-type peptidyl-prolyl cis-trans isomerase FkpA